MDFEFLNKICSLSAIWYSAAIMLVSSVQDWALSLGVSSRLCQESLC